MATTSKGIDTVLREMVITIDTREQRPFMFGNSGFPTMALTLKTGDYSIRGYEDRVAVERKEYGDFLGCVARQRRRFMEEMKRLANYEFKSLVIEADYSSIAQGVHPHSKVKPASALGTIVRLTVMGIPVVTAWDRKGAEDFTLKFLKRTFLTLRGIKT